MTRDSRIRKTRKMDQPARRTAPILAVIVFVLLICIGGAALAWQFRGDDSEPDLEADNYESVGVPWWDGRVHWSGHSTAEDDVASITASQDAAVFLHDRSEADFSDDDDFMQPGRGTLTALFADGSVKQLATEVLGVPLADPNGHLVAWMVQAGNDSVVVTAFDTDERVVLGSRRLGPDHLGLTVLGLTAVVGDTVYVSTGKEALAWQPRDGDDPRQVFEGSGSGWFLVVGEADDGLLVMGPRFEVHWFGSDGTQRRVDRFLGSVSPNGQYVATADQEEQYRRNVQAVLSGEGIDLGLPKDKLAYQARWAGDGTLVVAAVSRTDLEEHWDDAWLVTNYACDVPDGECRALDGGPHVIGHLPVYEDSSLGVLMIAFEGIGS